MDKAIVTGALGFLGFELCLAMLEEGLEVLAVDSKDETGERWLEVGRNSNITYQPMHRQMPEKDYKASVFINLYDYFTDKQGETLEQISRFLEKNKTSFTDAVLLLPTVLSDRTGEVELSDFLSFLKEQSLANHCSVYLPTLIGPKQPGSFLFQQLIFQSGEETEYVDDIRSAIYVKDAARTILLNERNLESFHLLSADKDSWKKSLGLLKKGETERGERQTLIDIIPKRSNQVCVKPSLSFEDVMELQKKS